MTYRSTLASMALLGLVALSPFTCPARGAVEYVVNYRANPDNPWLLYTTTPSLAEAQAAVAELQGLGYRAEYLSESVGGSAHYSYYSPGYTYYHSGSYHYDHYHFNGSHDNRYHYNHVHHHGFVYHHPTGNHHYVYHHSHVVHRRPVHHHVVHHYVVHHRR
jgi:hypothetical protein